MRNNTHPPKKRDHGNILPMTLVMMVVGSLMVVALMTFALTLLRNRPPLEERSDSLEAVRSAMRMAIVMQRDHGPDGCYESTNAGFVVNDRDITLSCEQITKEDDNGGRLGLITTSNNGLANGSTPNNEPVRVASGNTPKAILGSVFLNGGRLGGHNDSLAMTEGTLFGSEHSSPQSSVHRYTTKDPAVDLVFPVGTECSTLFGPFAREIDSAGPGFGYSDPIDVGVRTDLSLRVTPDAGNTIIGVLFDNGAGEWFLDRSVSHPGSGAFDVAPVDNNLSIRTCFQDLGSGDPDFIPTDLTFCDSPLVDPELVAQTGGSLDGLICSPNAWWDYAGWKPNLQPDYIYPLLPQIPSFARASSPIPVGSSSCSVFYPGRYADPIVLNDGGDYYFASGVYLLENELTVSNGSQVVAGEGAYQGCAFDADAAFLANSPRDHQIAGKGVTFLLGHEPDLGTDGKIVVDSASLRINRRVATSSTRASAGISVMSLNLATPAGALGDVEIPSNDRVLLPGCLASEVADDSSCAEDIATYGITPFVGANFEQYSASELGPNDSIIDVNLDGADRASNRVLIGGNVFVPNSRVELNGTAAAGNYALRLRNGAVASTFLFDFADGDDTDFLVGQETQTVYEKVKLVAVTTFNGQDFRSVVELEVDTANRYAINNWTVDAGSGDSLINDGSATTTTSDPAATTTTTSDPAATTTTTNPDVTTTTTTVPASTTTTSTTSTTTTSTTTTTTTTTTLPVPTAHDYCAANGWNWTRDLGDGGTWTAEFWDLGPFGGSPNNPFNGPPDATDTLNTVQWYLSDASDQTPNPAVDDDFFAARFKRTINVANECWMALAIGSDDGSRLYLDGTEIHGDWSPHGHQWDWDYHWMVAGEHELVVEYFELTGDSSLDFAWRGGY